jgi:FkbM family methyltransferase
MRTRLNARCIDSLKDFNARPWRVRNAYRSFFFTTGYMGFWGAGFHNEGIIRAASAIVPRLDGMSVLDVGAGRYATVGGDISHFLLSLSLWGCPTGGAAIWGFEPVERQYENLIKDLQGAMPAGMEGRRAGPTFELWSGGRRCAVLSSQPLSDRVATVVLENMPFAGDNTASLDPHYQHSNQLAQSLGRRRVDKQLQRRVRSMLQRRQQRNTTTVDSALASIGAPPNVLVMKVDVEGHERAVLQGANATLHQGRIHLLILEYGHSTSPQIWDAMKAKFSAAAAAPTPQEMSGNSLYSMQRWADKLGFEAFLLGGGKDDPVLVPVTGRYWDDAYEVCRDKAALFSPDNRTWWNFSAWRPNWTAECWYDVAFVHRSSPIFEALVTRHAALPARYCRRFALGWYPGWIDQPAPKRLECKTKLAKQIRNGCEGGELGGHQP